MPAFVLTAASVIICAHGGNVTPTAPDARVRIMGVPIAAQGPPYIVAGCINPPSPAGIGPCVVATWISAAQRVRAGGLPVLLQDSQALCDPTGTPVMVVATQPRVRAT